MKNLLENPTYPLAKTGRLQLDEHLRTRSCSGERSAAALGKMVKKTCVSGAQLASCTAWLTPGLCSDSALSTATTTSTITTTLAIARVLQPNSGRAAAACSIVFPLPCYCYPYPDAAGKERKA